MILTLLQKIFRSRTFISTIQMGTESALMAAYSYYMQNYYAEALMNLERYIKTYPESADVAYAQYLVQCVTTKQSKMKKETQDLF